MIAMAPERTIMHFRRLFLPALASLATVSIAAPPVPQDAGASTDFTWAKMTNFAAVLTVDDYPDAAARANQQGTVWVRIVVSSAGKPERCEVAVSTSYPILDQQTCALILKRAKFTPARDIQGQPIACVATLMFRWRLPESSQPVNTAEFHNMELTVPRSRGSDTQTEHSVMLLVAETGTVEDCRGTGDAELTEIGCREVRKIGRVRPISDGAGNPLRALISIRIKFNSFPS